MQLNGMTGRFFKVCEIISKLAYLNLLWFGFTILGLGIFGITPATVALFAITRKWIMGNFEIPIFTTFWQTFREEFFKSSLLGGVLLLFGYILYIDFAYLPAAGIFAVIRWGLMICALLYAILLLYIFPLYVHYEWKNKLYIKYALLLGSSHPHYTLLMVIGIGALYYVSVTIPGLIPFFSVSVLSLIVMWTSYQVIKRMEATQDEDIQAHEMMTEET